MEKTASDPRRFVEAIRRSQLSIYDPIAVGDPDLWIPSPELEVLLNRELTGLSLEGLPLRTRSKVVKEHVCRALGYPVPPSFRRTRPRFPGQAVDVPVQKSDNLQIWNDDLEPTRRYAIIRVSSANRIERVKVVTGTTLSLLDTTGTLTQKYQARIVPGTAPLELITPNDTELLAPLVRDAGRVAKFTARPTDHPSVETLLPIHEIFARLRPLVGQTFEYSGFDQERTRGAALHRLVCQQLGYREYRDDGRFPDVKNQLLEVKLQTSPTIDLGLVRPDSLDPLDTPLIRGRQIRHCDVRYAVFYATLEGSRVTLANLYLTTGEAFLTRFPQFKGKLLNRKLQIPLPSDFFSR